MAVTGSVVFALDYNLVVVAVVAVNQESEELRRGLLVNGFVIVVSMQ